YIRGAPLFWKRVPLDRQLITCYAIAPLYLSEVQAVHRMGSPVAEVAERDRTLGPRRSHDDRGRWAESPVLGLPRLRRDPSGHDCNIMMGARCERSLTS